MHELAAEVVAGWIDFEDIDDSATHFSDEPPYADGPGTWDYFF